MHKTALKHFIGLSTIFLGVNLIVPISVTAQTSGSSTVGQVIDASGGALTMPCSLGNFAFDPVEINAPTGPFGSYYLNPKTPDIDLISCGGTGVTVQDTRYDGGFVLQVAASEYLKDGVGPETIDIDQLNIVTEQFSPSYLEDSSGTSDFTGFPPGSLVTGSDLDDEVGENVEVQLTAPGWNFYFYGTDYGDTIYACTNGSIAFTSGQCESPLTSPAEDIFEDPQPRILPYYKDVTTASDAGGIYTDSSGGVITITWVAEPCMPDDLTPTLCEDSRPAPYDDDVMMFQVIFTGNTADDPILIKYNTTFLRDDYGDSPIVGMTKGGPSGTPTSATYTESLYSRSQDADNLLGKLLQYNPSGADFIEVVKPGTPAVVVSTKGDPNEDLDYTTFTEDGGNPGNSLNVDLINGNTDIGCGRVGLYTVYPSYRLDVPETTADGSYQNTITYTLSDSTGPGSGSC